MTKESAVLERNYWEFSSRYAIGDEVVINFTEDNKLKCIIKEVVFTEDKVFYNVETLIKYEANYPVMLYRIDSALIQEK